MSIFILFIFSSIALVLLMLHSYFFRGGRFTAYFFILCFLCVSLQLDRIIAIFNISYINRALTLFVFNSAITFIIVLICTVLVYVSIDITERIRERINIFKNNLFAAVCLNSLVILAFSYLLNIYTVNNGNGWHTLANPEEFLVLSNNYAQLFWSFFNSHFLLPLGIFYVVEYSRYKNSEWKALFILFIFIQYRVNILLGKNLFFSHLQGFVILSFLIILAFFNWLPFEDRDIQSERQRRIKNTFLILRNIPLFMLLIILAINIGILKKPILIISAIPVIFIALLSIKRIPLYIIFIISLIGLILGKEKMILPIVPVIVVFGFWVVSISKAYVSKKERVKTA